MNCQSVMKGRQGTISVAKEERGAGWGSHARSRNTEPAFVSRPRISRTLPWARLIVGCWSFDSMHSGSLVVLDPFPP